MTKNKQDVYLLFKLQTLRENITLFKVPAHVRMERNERPNGTIK